jgi:hypothetical protein
LIFLVCRDLSPGKSGCFAAAAVAVCPYLIFYSANGRGYSLDVFLTLVLILISFRYSHHSTRGGAGLIAVASALALLTMPSMLFMVAGACAWTAWLLWSGGRTSKFALFEFALPCGGLTVGLTALCYTPVVFVSNGFEHILRNRFVLPQPWGEFFQQLGPHLRQTVGALSWGVPWLAEFAIVILIIAGLRSAARRRNRAMFMLLPLTLASAAMILIAQHRIPFDRTWIFVLPLLLLVADAGFTRILEVTSPRLRSVAIGASVMLALYVGARLIAENPTLQYAAGDEFPDARLAAQFLKPMLAEGDAVRTSFDAEAPTFFYLWRDTSVVNPVTHKTVRPRTMFYAGDQEFHYSFMSYHDADNSRVPTTSEPKRVFYVLKKSECTVDASSMLHIVLEPNETLEIPAGRVIKILDRGDMAIYRQADNTETASVEQ